MIFWVSGTVNTCWSGSKFDHKQNVWKYWQYRELWSPRSILWVKCTVLANWKCEILGPDHRFKLLFSSPEPKAQVSYCHSAPSVGRPRPSSSVNFHIFNFFYRTAWWILMKLGRDEVLMVPYKCCLFFSQIRPGVDPGRGKNRSRGSPSLRNFFFRPEGYSNKLNA